MTTFTLPRWMDLHAHLRQDELLPFVIQDHLQSGAEGILAMPNTKPPVAKVFTSDDLPYWSIESYIQMIQQNGGEAFEHIIVPLYLTKDTTPEMIQTGAKSGILKACKYYPPNGTTGAEFGCDMETLIQNGVLQAMSDNNVILCTHGEEHNLCAEHYFDRTQNAEEIFYQTVMPRIRNSFPNLKIIGEHLTTKVAVDFIKAHPQNTTATITPQHLLYTIGHLLQGLKYHLYCLPLLKFEEDRQALRDAVTDPNNTQFFAGTDSAPHTTKATDCGCAAGCYTALIGPQLYAEAFDLAGCDLSNPKNQLIFKRFLCEVGPEFYGLKTSEHSMQLTRKNNTINITDAGGKKLVPLPIGLGSNTLKYQLKKV